MQAAPSLADQLQDWLSQKPYSTLDLLIESRVSHPELIQGLNELGAIEADGHWELPRLPLDEIRNLIRSAVLESPRSLDELQLQFGRYLGVPKSELEIAVRVLLREVGAVESGDVWAIPAPQPKKRNRPVGPKRSTPRVYEFDRTGAKYVGKVLAYARANFYGPEGYLSLDELERKSGISKTILSQIERSVRGTTIPLDTLYCVYAVLNSGDSKVVDPRSHKPLGVLDLVQKLVKRNPKFSNYTVD